MSGPLGPAFYLGKASAMGLGCVETMRDEGVIGSVADIAAPGGYFRIFGVIAVLMADLAGYP